MQKPPEIEIESCESTPKQDSLSTESEGVFCFDHTVTLTERMKDFRRETATAGPKLVTEIKEDPNSTKAINKRLKKIFKQKKKKKVLEERDTIGTKTIGGSITNQIFGTGKTYNDADAMAEVQEKNVQVEEFYKMMATKAQDDAGVEFLSEEGKLLDRSSREAEGMLDMLKNMLLICKERLKLITDDGFIH